MCCGLRFVNLFHSNSQLEAMLKNNFDGRRFIVKSQDSTNLDCMFFPCSDEKVLLKKEMAVTPPDYHSYPTVIFFNPNAQSY